MSDKLYIIDISFDTAQIVSKTSKFSGTHFAKYCLASIDEKTNKMITKFYTGDVLSCLRNILIYLNGRPLELANFKVTLKSTNNVVKSINKVTLPMLVNVIDVDVHSDGNNSLTRLYDCTHIAIANVIGIRGKQEIDYGCVKCSKDGHCEMISWKKLQALMQKGKLDMHNVTLHFDEKTSQTSLIRTNISNLGTIYLTVNIDTPDAEKVQNTTKVTKNAKEQEKKQGLLKGLTDCRSPLMYSLTEDYPLDAMQYIIKTYTQGEPIDYMLNADYTVEQLRVLHRAYKEGIDITIIADPSVSAKTMENIRKKFEYGLWECINFGNLRK